MRFLLPIDVQSPSKRTTGLVACLSKALGARLEEVVIVTVMAGHYLAEHIKNIDTRAGHILDSALIESLRSQHIEKDVRPVLDSVKDELVAKGVSQEIRELILDGDPVEKIQECVEREGITHVFLERRGMGPAKEILLGSISSGLLHRDISASIYLVGKKLKEDAVCTVERCLIPVDGSEHSKKALKEAAQVLGSCVNGLSLVHLYCVVDVAKYPERLEDGKSPEKDAERILDEARAILEENGVSQAIIKADFEYGYPAKNIIRMIKEQDIDLVFMGRRGRGLIQDFLMGSVSREVIYNCPEPTIAVITG